MSCLVQFSSVTQSCLTLCDPVNHSIPGLPVRHQLLELLKFMSFESVMPSSHLILCRPLLFLPPIPPSIRVFGVIAHQITLQQKQKKNHPKTKGSSSEKPLSCGQQQPWRPGLGLAPATASPADVCPTGSFFPSRGLRPSQDAARPAREADRPSPAFTGEFCREHGHVRGSQRRGCPRAAHGPSRCAVEAAGLEGGFSGTGGLDPLEIKPL